MGLIDQAEVFFPLLVGKADIQDRVAFYNVGKGIEIEVLVDKSSCVLVVTLTLSVQVEDCLECLATSYVLDEAATAETFILVLEQVEFFNVAKSLKEIGDLLLVKIPVHV